MNPPKMVAMTIPAGGVILGFFGVALPENPLVLTDYSFPVCNNEVMSHQQSHNTTETHLHYV